MDGRPERGEKVTVAHVERAVGHIVAERSTHLENLQYRLSEDRVLSVIRALEEQRTTGMLSRALVSMKDRRYAQHLGLVAQGADGRYSYANKIYEMILPRVLGEMLLDLMLPDELSAWLPQENMRALVKADGDVDIDGHLDWFVERFSPIVDRLNKTSLTNDEELLRKRTLIGELTLHTPLYMCLASFVNGSGLVRLESVVDRGAVDFLIKWPVPKEAFLEDVSCGKIPRTIHDPVHFDVKQHIIEVKYWRPSNKANMSNLVEAIHQTADYARDHGRQEGHLFVYDLMERPFVFDATGLGGLPYELTTETLNTQSDQENGFRCRATVGGGDEGTAQVTIFVRVHHMGTSETPSLA